ncbi:class I SAM-dependent methyltransferase (plasmid) [Halorussus salilacus]|uniref:class I SAM-dependent methyltransferase n=1 Tax=Halorussus salilacus TaxID=2953750 RepID=UPI00209E03C6|nr:class I SAM-dependent methyltransferase [Halorussus salilacus]USZ70011.1 class I SAM-dependent methyltransferase [Halorussus salilacus]
MEQRKGSWDDWYERVDGDVDEDIVKLASILEDEGKERVLDVGCGAGRHLMYLARHGFDLHGFDFSESAVDALTENLASADFDADVRQANFAEEFVYEDEYFDATIATVSINHADLETIEHAVAEMYRVLKPSGLVYVQLPTYQKLVDLKEDGEEFEKVEPGTVVPLEGPEEGIPHHNFRRDEVMEVFSEFEPMELTKRGDNFCFLARKPDRSTYE